MSTENNDKVVISKNDWSFREAYDSIPKNKIEEVREKIKEVFGVRTYQAMYFRIQGKYEPKASEAKGIEMLFKSYGIKVNWGR